jgi:hypothetical protein
MFDVVQDTEIDFWRLLNTRRDIPAAFVGTE